LVIAVALSLALLLRMQPGKPLATGPGPGDRFPAGFSGLRSPSGEPADDRWDAGGFRLVAFGFTSCPDICPTTLAAVHDALQRLGARAALVRSVFVTLDPERDDAQRLAQYVSAFDPRIEGLRGTPAATASVAARYGVRFARRIVDARSGAYVIDHTAGIFIVDSSQRMVRVIPVNQSPLALSAAIVTALDDASGGKT
jgi:protein SCO1/2